MYSDFNEIDECIDTECPCSCHTTIDSSDLIRYDEEFTVWQHSAAQRAKRYERKGVFPFLKLPGEVRDRIYRYVVQFTWLYHLIANISQASPYVKWGHSNTLEPIEAR